MERATWSARGFAWTHCWNAARLSRGQRTFFTQDGRKIRRTCATCFSKQGTGELKSLILSAQARFISFQHQSPDHPSCRGSGQSKERGDAASTHSPNRSGRVHKRRGSVRDNLSVNTAFNEFSHPISVSVLPGGTFQGMGLNYSKYRFP